MVWLITEFLNFIEKQNVVVDYQLYVPDITYIGMNCGQRKQNKRSSRQTSYKEVGRKPTA